jgi:hypothetical protein
MIRIPFQFLGGPLERVLGKSGCAGDFKFSGSSILTPAVDSLGPDIFGAWSESVGVRVYIGMPGTVSASPVVT